MKEYHATLQDFPEIIRGSKTGKFIFENLGIIYFKNGYPHRLDGPAADYFNGDKRWFINGEQFSSKEEYETALYLYKNQLENYQ